MSEYALSLSFYVALGKCIIQIMRHCLEKKMLWAFVSPKSHKNWAKAQNTDDRRWADADCS